MSYFDLKKRCWSLSTRREVRLNLLFVHCNLVLQIMLLNICAAYILHISIKSILFHFGSNWLLFLYYKNVTWKMYYLLQE